MSRPFEFFSTLAMRWQAVTSAFAEAGIEAIPGESAGFRVAGSFRHVIVGCRGDD
jgi:hypothetical protein